MFADQVGVSTVSGNVVGSVADFEQAGIGAVKPRSAGKSVKAVRARATKSAATQSGSAAGWLKSAELAEPMRAWSPDRVDFADGSRDHCKRLTRRLLKTEIGFIGHPEFDQPGIGDEIFAEPLGLSAPSSQQAASTLKRTAVEGVDQVGRLCEAKLLTPAQESMLFRRMNFLRHQAVVARAQLDPERPSRKDIAHVHCLIALADWHRDRIVEANTRLVFSIVKKFVNTSNSFDDLLSDGIVALMRAVEKFDFGRGFRFSTYATQVVRRGAYRQVMESQQERSKMQSGVEDLGLDVSDEGRQSAISEQRWHELRGRLSVMLGDLDRRERFIIRARFSLGSHRRVHTLQALADRLGVSKERVRQLEQRAMEKLRGMAGEVGIAELET